MSTTPSSAPVVGAHRPAPTSPPQPVDTPIHTSSRQQLLNDLVAERFSGPVREYRQTSRTAPIAELLDALTLEHDQHELTVIRDAS